MGEREGGIKLIWGIGKRAEGERVIFIYLYSPSLD